jgi:hypothetical protein
MAQEQKDAAAAIAAAAAGSGAPGNKGRAVSSPSVAAPPPTPAAPPPSSAAPDAARSAATKPGSLGRVASMRGGLSSQPPASAAQPAAAVAVEAPRAASPARVAQDAGTQTPLQAPRAEANARGARAPEPAPPPPTTAWDYFAATVAPLSPRAPSRAAAAATAAAAAADARGLVADEAPTVRTAADYFRGAATRATINTSGLAAPPERGAAPSGGPACDGSGGGGHGLAATPGRTARDTLSAQVGATVSRPHSLWICLALHGSIAGRSLWMIAQVH